MAFILVANKIFGRRCGSHNFVADISSNAKETKLNIPTLSQPSFTSTNTHKYKYKVFASTWNVGGIEPHDNLDMEDWLDTCSTSCDIYVLGFQEIVPLRAGNILRCENRIISNKWNAMIREALNNKFKCIISKQMVGIFISVWIRTELIPFIRHSSVSCIGCGIMGCLGNKGSVSVRFMLYETSFCFVCTHLASGGREKDEIERNSNVMEIFSRTRFPRGSSIKLPRKILDHDRVILLGDLNYRISLPEATTRSLVNKGEWNTLLENDQLRREFMKGKVFQNWHEGTIKFAPTYKYSSNSDTYHGHVQGRKGEKRRAPAWCDRVIWHGKGLWQLVYSRGESKLSDHRPVKAIFSVEVKVSRNLKEFQKILLIKQI